MKSKLRYGCMAGQALLLMFFLLSCKLEAKPSTLLTFSSDSISSQKGNEVERIGKQQSMVFAITQEKLEKIPSQGRKKLGELKQAEGNQENVTILGKGESVESISASAIGNVEEAGQSQDTEQPKDTEQSKGTEQPVDSEQPVATEQPAATEHPVNPEQPKDFEQPKDLEEPELPKEQIVTLLAVGDNLLHQKVIDSGKLANGNYNYDHLFSRLSEEIKAADIAVINQETILGTKKMGYSGYPRFCSPTAVGRAIAKVGFDIVLHANNHTLDKGTEGITTTLKYWSRFPMITPIGIHNSKEEAEEITYYEKNGITFALFNATYGLNGNALPKSKSYLIDCMNQAKLKKQISEAKKKADFLIVFPHWGAEYVYKANAYQKEYAQFFADLGVDLVIGSHPHVLQPVEWIEGKNGHKTLVYYSLGNYISSMDYTDRMLGGMANITIVKKDDKTYIKSASITPIVTHYERGGTYNFTVYKLSDYTQTLATKHYILKGKWGNDFSLKALQKLAESIVGDFHYEETDRVN